MACIYKIINKINNKFYIGSTHNTLDKRKGEHISYLKNNKHHSGYLQKSYNKYGKDSFEFKILETYLFPQDYSLEYINEYIGARELYYITLLNPDYNICREYNRGVLGRKKTPEECAKISISKIGKKRTDGCWVGRKHKEDSKKKMSIAKLGKLRGPISENTRIKMSLAQKGKSLSNDRIEFLRTINIGRKASTETKKKMSESHKRRQELIKLNLS